MIVVPKKDGSPHQTYSAYNMTEILSINNDKIAKAVMQYRNTLLSAISLSPSQILFHRELRDFTPSHPTHYQLHKDWIITHEQQEFKAAKQNLNLEERYNATVHELQQLSVGTPVLFFFF